MFHVVRNEDLSWDAQDRYSPPSLQQEGFIHCSFHEALAESARLYFQADDDLTVLRIDPRRLDVAHQVKATSRGPMPHVLGTIPRDAVQEMTLPEALRHPALVSGTRVGFAAFQGMTLLDLVGPLDAVSRIASMGFDPTTTCEVFALTDPAATVWNDCGATFGAKRYRPPLSEFDLLVLPGGFGTRRVENNSSFREYLGTFPVNRRVATVCTGALLLASTGRLRGRRATTHASAFDDLAVQGVTVVAERVVEDGPYLTAGGVTAGIDLGLALVKLLCGPDIAAKIARQMEHRGE